jgi:hypothetical protein
MMEAEVEEGRREMSECDRVKAKVEGALKDIEKQAEDVASNKEAAANGAAKGSSVHGDAKRLWKMMMDINPGAG